MADWTVVALRFAIMLALALAFGVPLQSFLAGGRVVARRSLLLLVSAAMLLSALGLIVLTAAMAGTDILPVDRDTLAMIVAETALGRSFVIRFAALALAFAALAAPMPIGPRRQRTIIGAAGMAMATLAWTGHGAMDEGGRGWIHLTADIVHLLAAGAWIGAIALLLASVAGGTGGRRMADVRAALAGFAVTGSVLVGSIAVSGAVNSWLILGRDGIAQLFRTDYGVLLSAKIALFGAMLLIAATNRWLLTPLLDRAIAADRTRDAVRWLRISLVTELACATGILAIVAWLGTLSPQG